VKKRRNPTRKGGQGRPRRAKRTPRTQRSNRTQRTKRTQRTQRTQRTKRTKRTQQAPIRWNPDPEDVQKSVVKLVLSLMEFIRKLMERQAIRRLEEKTLTPAEIENVGLALMKLEQTVHLIAKRFKLDPKELNLDLGPLGKLH